MQPILKLYKHHLIIFTLTSTDAPEQGELHIHHRSGTAQQRTNHHGPSRARGLADRHDRPRRGRRPARAARPGPRLAPPARPPRL